MQHKTYHSSQRQGEVALLETRKYTAWAFQQLPIPSDRVKSLCWKLTMLRS
ncbi:hypothetical protein [Iningainema tapete]|uniref:hypothetical protein n=1 Tax=Iningainema tapete TaxID=2806730 RepID=UPI003B589169